MVVVKTARELSKMKDACRISAEALRVAGEAVKPGVTTYEIDNIVRSYIEKQGAVPSFLGYGGFLRVRAFPLTMWLSMAYPVKNSF